MKKDYNQTQSWNRCLRIPIGVFLNIRSIVNLLNISIIDNFNDRGYFAFMINSFSTFNAIGISVNDNRINGAATTCPPLLSLSPRMSSRYPSAVVLLKHCW